MKPSKCMEWLSLIMLIQASFCYVNGFIGMNWGRMAYQKILPSMVVDMFLQSGIHEVKIFSHSDNVLDAFEGTDIGVTVTVPNASLRNLDTTDACKGWIQENIVQYIQKGVNIRYVTVGAEPYSRMYFNQTFYYAFQVLQNMQIALRETDFGGKVVKATMNHFTDVMNDAVLPSESDFNPEIKDLMIKTCRVLKDDDAPMWLDMFPIYNALNVTNDIEFAYFNNNSTRKFIDDGIIYSNIFQVMYDKFMVALEKNGLSGLRVIAGQLGWPTDGIQGGSVKNAERFYNSLVPYFLFGRGTPRHPGPIDMYVHNFHDENSLPFKNHTMYIRHWGIYNFDGQPKFNVDFTGKRRPTVSAKGITHMPKRWCIFLNDSTDWDTINHEALEACRKSDCTGLFPGGACWNLPFETKVSYAFNMYFQSKSQKLSDEACNFKGFGVIVPYDPSPAYCPFPVGIIQAETAVGTPSDSMSNRIWYPTPLLIFMLLWILCHDVISLKFY